MSNANIHTKLDAMLFTQLVLSNLCNLSKFNCTKFNSFSFLICSFILRTDFPASDFIKFGTLNTLLVRCDLLLDLFKRLEDLLAVK